MDSHLSAGSLAERASWAEKSARSAMQTAAMAKRRRTERSGTLQQAPEPAERVASVLSTCNSARMRQGLAWGVIACCVLGSAMACGARTDMGGDAVETPDASTDAKPPKKDATPDVG